MSRGRPRRTIADQIRVKNPSKGQTTRSENGKLLATFDVKVRADGSVEYSRLAEGAKGEHQTVSRAKLSGSGLIRSFISTSSRIGRSLGGTLATTSTP